MPDGLAVFLAARLDEAEQNISYAGPARIAWLTYLRDDGQLAYTTIAAGVDNSPWVADGRELPEPASVRVIWDPARELRAITAKRAILADCTAKLRYPANAPMYNLAIRTLRNLAAEWDDHPAYLPEWSPEPATAP